MHKYSIVIATEVYMKFILQNTYWKIYNFFNNTMIFSNDVIRKTKIGKMVRINKGNKIGVNVEIGDYSYISGPGSVIENCSIGKFCSIALGVKIGMSNHDYSKITTHTFYRDPRYRFIKSYSKQNPNKKTIIGNDVWIGADSIIFSGVNVGDGAVIGAKSLVNKDIPAYAIAVGNPARIIKYRFSDENIKKLLIIKWWNWAESEIKKSLKYIHSIDEFNNKYYN